MTIIADSLAEISAPYDALFVDLWGCLHNGLTPYPAAVSALQGFRAKGGRVVLLTNSPRPRAGVIRQLDRMGVPKDCYDEVASSGDATQAAMTAGMVGQKLYHIGPPHDETFFRDIAPDVAGPVTITRIPLSEAEGIICTGLFEDDHETPEDYRATILDGVNRGLKFLCANPDLVVDYGDKRIYCAGALAQAYEEAGGKALYFGKPHAPIYQLAQSRLTNATGQAVDPDRVLCIGDGIHTDVRGAMAEGMDSLFLTAGLAAEDIPLRDGTPDRAALETYLQAHRQSPTYTMAYLR